MTNQFVALSSQLSLSHLQHRYNAAFDSVYDSTIDRFGENWSAIASGGSWPVAGIEANRLGGG